MMDEVELTSVQRGSWGMAKAITWLLERGWEVFVGFSGQEECDLVVVQRGTRSMLKVEVKAATPLAGKAQVAIKDFDAYDILLVVMPDGTVHQDPGVDVCYGTRRTNGFSICKTCGQECPLRSSYCPGCGIGTQKKGTVA